jgi:prefoldin alpha subunit
MSNNNNNKANNDKTATSTSTTTTIDLDTLSLDQLHQMKQEQEGRLQALTQRYAALRAAAARLHASQTAITELSPASSASSSSSSSSSSSLSYEGKPVMIPLTESVYVPGTIKEPNNLLVDIGTGFYVEKTSQQTNEFLARKLQLVNANSETITVAVQTLQSNITSIHQAMQGKLLEIQARQQGQRHRQQTMEEEEEEHNGEDRTTDAVAVAAALVDDDDDDDDDGDD